MNKILLGSAITLASAAFPATAAQQSDIQFFGNVSSVTCDVSVNIGGSSVANVVQLGTVAPNTESTTPAEFSLVSQDPRQAGCTSLSAKTATVTWKGNFDNNGLKSQGTATDAIVKLTAINPKDQSANANITASNTAVDFDAEMINSEGFKFEATLQGGSIPGDYQGVAAYAVTYN